jgi:hypothetical protein
MFGGGIFKNLFKPGSRTKINKRNMSRGNLVRIPQKIGKIKDPGWKDLTYRKVQVVPHEKNETRGKRVVTKTTYHNVKNEDNLSKRKLKKEFQSEGHGNIVPHYSTGRPHQTHITQKIKTKFHDSRRWNDEVQDRKKKKVEYTTGNTLASQKKDSSYDTKTTYRSKSKYLRADKEGQALVKAKYEDSGIKGLKKVRIRGKVDRAASNKYKDPGCAEPFGFCPNHADGTVGTLGNKPLKSTHIRTYKKGTSADDAFAGRINPSGNPLAMNEMIGFSVKKTKAKTYGDKRGTQSIIGHPDGKAPQYKSNKGRVNKKKIKFHDRKTIRLKQNIFDDNLAQGNSPMAGYIKAKDFRQLKRDRISRQSMKDWKSTGKINNNIARKND